MNPPPIPQPPEKPAGTYSTTITPSQMRLVGLCLFFLISSFLLRMIYSAKLETTSVMFIFLPAMVAILLSLTGKPKSALGSAMKGTTLGLLLSAVVFGEGLICVLMAAPIAYLIAGIVGASTDVSRRRQNKSFQSVVWVIVALTSLEGTTNSLSLRRDESVKAERIVAASLLEVENALAATPSFKTPLPTYFRLGFPKPVETHGRGLQVGDERVIHFAGGEGHPGDLVLRIAEHTPSSVTFHAESDHSKIAHWLAWQKSTVQWTRVDATHTRVTLTLRYRRGLDPAWYFRPWERYAVRLAGEYLIDNLATPSR